MSVLYKCFLWTTAVCVAANWTTAAPGIACWTQDGVPGLCWPMTECNRITRLLTFWEEPFPAHVVDYVRRSYCHNNGTKYYGCCAHHDIDRGASPSSRITDHGFLSSNTASVPPHRELPSRNHAGEAIGNQHRPQAAPVGRQILQNLRCGTWSNDRISNGEEVRLFELPWMALLEYEGTRSRNRFKCGATLISERYVLTAAHCIAGQKPIIGVRLGEHNLLTEPDCQRYYTDPTRESHCSPPYVHVGVEQVLPHAAYTWRPLRNDIGLVRLNQSVAFQSHVQPICMPLPEFAATTLPRSFTIAGWGTTEQGIASNVLRKAEVALQRIGVCQAVYQQGFQMNDNHLCCGGGDAVGAKDVPTSSTCRGDSGGPLMAPVHSADTTVRYVQFGITSAGEAGCGSRNNLPSVYTNVAPFLDWIVNNLRP